MRGRWLWILLLIGSPSSALAAIVSLGTNTSVNWNRNDTSLSPFFVVPLFNSQTDSETITSWRIGLRFEPEAGATGTLAFNTESITTNYEPPNYIFQDINDGIENVTPTAPSQFSLNDIVNLQNEDGVSVPASGRNLVQFRFSSPGNNALGTFRVFAVASAQTGWEAGPPDFDERQFANVGPGDLLLGTITVIAPIPEPGVLILVGLGAGGLFVGRLARRRKETPSKQRQKGKLGKIRRI